MMRISGDWLTQPETQAVCAALSDFQVYFVGGCVRNDLLQVPVADIDISTNARPEQVTAAGEAAGLRVIPTGIEHGTVTVVSGGIPFEVTTFRRDVETDGRRAVVAYADTIEHDALRRDFTMNALYATPDGAIVDPLGGLPDLKARQIRFIEDADQRIKEDYLRILRFFRFHAWYGDVDVGMDVDALAAIASNTDGLDTLSKERVGAEMIKLLAAPDPAPSVATMMKTGTMIRVLPGASNEALAPLIHLEAGADPAPLRRLASLGGEDVANALRLSKQQATELSKIRAAALGDDGPATLAYRFGKTSAHDAILVRSALLSQELPIDLAEMLDAGSSAKFPIKALDLMDNYQGPALGEKLKQLEDTWIGSNFQLTKSELLK